MSFLSKMRKIGLNRMLKPVKPLLPPKVKKWINQDRKKHRNLVVTDEINRVYHDSIVLLKDEIGELEIRDYLEFGVNKGTSLSCMIQNCKKHGLRNTRFFGFDSFEGLPETAKNDDEGAWKPGAYSFPYKETCKYLEKRDVDWDNTYLIKGWFSDTLNEKLVKEYSIDKASFIMVDSDMYLSAKEALDFCGPLIKDKTIIYFDDWSSGDNLAKKNLGEKRAFEEFLNENQNFEAKQINRYKDIFGRENGIVFLVSNTDFLSN